MNCNIKNGKMDSHDKKGNLSGIMDNTSDKLISLLGLYRINFDLYRDISNKDTLTLLQSGHYNLSNFEENGYGCIQRKNPDMGTGYALVSEQYFEKRGDIQGIYIFEESEIVGKTFYKNSLGERINTNIYFVGSIPSSGKSISGGLSNADISEACKKLLGI